MRVFRLARKKFVRDLSGEGARLFGGRWNSKGVAMIYASDTPSLATLEALVHLSPALLPPDYCLAALEVPENAEVEILTPARLPRGWRDCPAPAALVAIGDEWAWAGRSLILQGPSAIIPAQHNILINPAHPAARRITITRIEKFHFDPRLLK